MTVVALIVEWAVIGRLALVIAMETTAHDAVAAGGGVVVDDVAVVALVLVAAVDAFGTADAGVAVDTAAAVVAVVVVVAAVAHSQIAIELLASV